MAAKPKEKFDAAVRVIHSLPKNGSFQPSHDLMLKFYAYFKQATKGPCELPRPSFWDIVGKAKWEAWNKLGNMPPEEAMLNYVEELKKIIEAMPHTNMVAEFVEKLGSFYELVDDKLTVNGSVVHENSGNTMNGAEPVPTETSFGKGSPDSEPSSESDVPTPHPSPTHFCRPSPPITPVSSDTDNAVVMTTIPVKPIPTSWKSEELPDLPGVPGLNEGSIDLNDAAFENGHDGDDELELPSDSDGDEFCDTLDLPQQLTMSQSSSPDVTAHRRIVTEATVHYDETDSVSEASMKDDIASPVDQHPGNQPEVVTEALTSRGGGDMGGSEQSPSLPTPDPTPNPAIPRPGGDISDQTPLQRSYLLAAGGAGGGSHQPGSLVYNPEVTEQIAIALVRLQQDMNSILARLNTLEALSLAQHQIQRTRSSSENEHPVQNRTPWWWPFPQLECRTVFFIVAWPLMVHWVLSVLARRRHRRR